MMPEGEMDSIKGKGRGDERDAKVLRLYEQVLEIEQRLIPTGLHVFGEAPATQGLRAILEAVASFDRFDPDPHAGARSDTGAASARRVAGSPVAAGLTDLIAGTLGLGSYQGLVDGSSRSDKHARNRERVEALLRGAVEAFLSVPEDAGAKSGAEYLYQEAGVATDDSLATFELLGLIRSELRENTELDSLAAALRGQFIKAGPGADIIQNPDVLPTGRNTHAVNPYLIPSPVAVQRAARAADALLDRFRKEKGRYPETMAMVLWGIDNIKTQGEAVAQALYLLGVRPRRDSLNRATGIEVIPLALLGRPRIDVVMTVSGIFRDLFGSTMNLLDTAVRTVAGLDEPPDMNFVRRHVTDQTARGVTLDESTARVFSNAAGNYGTNVNFMVLDSQWQAGSELGDLFVTRKCFAYGREREANEARAMMEKCLARVELTYQVIDSSEIGITDVDHYFEYLGGVSSAVEQQAGSRPAIYLSDSTAPYSRVRTLEETIRLETRTKTLNPKWYEGLLKHGFSGVAEIEHHVTNTFGWSATADAVDKWIYDEVAETFVLDDAMLERLKALNLDSTRSMVGRLLEAAGRGIWAADEKVLERLRGAFEDIEDRIEGVVA
jgi:magnesium chelatase subunit H